MPKKVECRFVGGILGKDCSKCSLFLAKGYFNSDSKTSTGLSSWCRGCRKEYGKKYQKRIDSKKRREYSHRALYGMTLGDYEKLLEAQNYRCAICETDKPGTGRFESFCVDHDHKTGKVRGLLCRNCNSGIGLFNEDPERIRLAIKYIQEH